MPFKALGLAPELLRGVEAMGYDQPTPIQLRAIPAVLTGKDLIASAQTGTGKTAAFALPVLSKLGKHIPRNPRVLVLEPTRELAAQVETAFRDFARFTDLKAVVVHGGVGYGYQRTELKRGVDVIVATPGRLMDFMREGMPLRTIEVLILDEVDRMLDMGFLPAVREIIAACPKQRQTLFFSATVPPQIAEVASFALRDPVRIEIGVNRSVNKSVNHAMYPVNQGQKFDLLVALLKEIDFQSVLVFTRTKHGADKIARRLRDANHSVAVLHANRTQGQRVDALEGFKSGRYEVMVATDIAARGIDVAGVSHVINYDIPANPEDYVHRIGRTGRAQAVGDAFTLTTPEERQDVHAIERFIGQKVPQLKLEGFPYGTAPAPDLSKPKAGGGRKPFGKPSLKPRSDYFDNRGPQTGGGDRPAKRFVDPIGVRTQRSEGGPAKFQGGHGGFGKKPGGFSGPKKFGSKPRNRY